MCEYIDLPYVIPGWGCCRCRIYNGLHRKKCHVCGEERHDFKVPDNILLCKKCGLGLPPGLKPTSTLAGRDVRGRCPNPECNEPWPTIVEERA
jgi:hypothetical protein